MADLNERLSLADQVLADAMIAIVAACVFDAERHNMRLQVLVRVLPRVNREHVFVDPLAIAANALIDAAHLNGKIASKARCSANLKAAAAVERFSEWRLGLVLAAMGDASHTQKENAA